MHLFSRAALIGIVAFAQNVLAADGGVDAGVSVADGGVADGGIGNGGVDAGLGDDAGIPVDAGATADDAGPIVDDAGPTVDAGFIGDDGGVVDEDAGTVSDDGGVVACAPFCSGSELVFCDDQSGEELAIDCDALGARCGLLDTEWGFDCLLPAGAACEAGYALGASRCDPDLGLFCTDGACSTTLPGDEELPEVPGSAGGIGSVADGEQHPLWFLGCTDANSPTIPFFGLTFSAWWLARRRRSKA
jgi:hypothetical protein